MKKKAVIFDLDGVIVSTDEFHFQAWKKMVQEEGIHFDRQINERLRGISRRQSLEIIIENSTREYSEEEKQELTDRKNGYYRSLIKNELTADDILPGVMNLLTELKEEGIKIAVGSSSRNTPLILASIGLEKYFNAVVDGNDIENSKPDPEVFVMAANRLGVSPEDCLVIEDAKAGVEAALAGGMDVLGVGSAANDEKATYTVESLAGITRQNL